MPSAPVVMGAYAKAVSERGEDGGNVHMEAFQRYKEELSRAIQIDSGRVPHETWWKID